ncbi:MAG: tail fiber domain-containing protein [Bacteroidia bacterium]|nr:tail fiber domain-containing protein [Bacteroidia bacterium]
MLLLLFAYSISYGQNVGIGTSTPTQRLTVNGNIMLFTGATDGARLIWRGGTGGTLAYRARVASAGYLGFFPVEAGDPGYVGEVLALTQSGLVGIGHVSPATRLHIHEINPTDITLRITSSVFGVHKGIQVGHINGWYFGETPAGDFGINRDIPIGAGTPVFRIYQAGQPRMSHFITRNSGIPGTGVNNDGPTNVAIDAGVGSARRFDWPNGWAGGLSTWDICLESIYASNYVTRSDRSYKTNIMPIFCDASFIDKFMRLNPVTYNYSKELGVIDDWNAKRLHYGFIANEVENLFPDIVVNAGMDQNVKRGLEYDAFIPMLVKVVQEQQKIIQEQQKKIERIEKLLQNQK